jgi:hypothetical protein
VQVKLRNSAGVRIDPVRQNGVLASDRQVALNSSRVIQEEVKFIPGESLMEIWFEGSADGRRAAWAALILNVGRKPRLIYGTACNIPCSNADRWAARQVLARQGGMPPNDVMMVTDRQDNVTNPVNRRPRLSWMWRSRRHPVIHHVDREANALRRGLIPPMMA